MTVKNSSPRILFIEIGMLDPANRKVRGKLPGGMIGNVQIAMDSSMMLADTF